MNCISADIKCVQARFSLACLVACGIVAPVDRKTKQQRDKMKTLAKINTADFADCTNTGWTYTLYSDGHLSAEWHSCWQGSHNGRRYITDPGYVDVTAIDPADPDGDAEALLTVAVQRADPCDPDQSVWRMVRRGYVVR